MNETEATVYVIDDDNSVRSSLRWLIESVQLTVREFKTANEFLDTWHGDGTGCIILDVRMPGMSGLDLQDMLVQRGIHLPVIIVTGHADVSMAVRAFKSGAFDFIEKPFNDQHLIDRIQQAIEKCRSEQIEVQRKQQALQRLSTLSRREQQVLDLVIAGSSNKQIARELDISIKTVESHRSNLMTKMQVNSVSELVRLALIADRG